MGFSVEARNAMLDGEGDAHALWVSLHTADPGADGGAELTGGSPAYARKAVTWLPATGGSKRSAVDVEFDIPPNSTVAFFGVWSEQTGGSWRGGGPLLTTETFNAQGRFRISAGDAELALA